MHRFGKRPVPINVLAASHLSSSRPISSTSGAARVGGGFLVAGQPGAGHALPEMYAWDEKRINCGMNKLVPA